MRSRSDHGVYQTWCLLRITFESLVAREVPVLRVGAGACILCWISLCTLLVLCAAVWIHLPNIPDSHFIQQGYLTCASFFFLKKKKTTLCRTSAWQDENQTAASRFYEEKLCSWLMSSFGTVPLIPNSPTQRRPLTYVYVCLHIYSHSSHHLIILR